MTWIEKEVDTNVVSNADRERSKLLDMVKSESLPTMIKEDNAGAPGFKPVEFQPVKSPGIYEGEFGVKGRDLIFHFWPAGYHIADGAGRATPRFKPGFKEKLQDVMVETFGSNRTIITDDADVGGICVLATGWGENQFFRKLSIKACEALHKVMGGES